jgi:hypothetical protein
MNSDKTVTANFTQNKYLLTINIEGNGSVDIDPNLDEYFHGTVVNITAIADPGWSFNYWSGDLISSKYNESIIMDSDKTITVNFTLDKYILTIITQGGGGVSRNPNQNNYTYGTEVELTAIGNPGWKFDRWSGDITAGKTNPAIINMTSDKSITAHFIQSSGGSSPPPPPPGGSTYKDPTADANGPYYGIVGEEIEFNGSSSYDNDEDGESIDSYDWKFHDEDEWHIDQGATPIYIYGTPGVYNVSLRVYDNEDSYDIDTTTAIITLPNLPPEDLTIVGEFKGHQNTSYTYDISARDPEGGNITYTVNWGDGQSYSSNPQESESVFSIAHMWTAYGSYIVTVSAVDELSAETIINVEILIDIHYVKDLGYLIDNDSDTIYDDFYSNSTNEKTITEQTDDERYLINSDEDDNWDWIYDPEDDTLEPYYDKKAGPDDDNLLWWLLALLILLIILAIIYLLYKRRNKKKRNYRSFLMTR